jgi:hypothetical protein
VIRPIMTIRSWAQCERHLMRSITHKFDSDRKAEFDVGYMDQNRLNKDLRSGGIFECVFFTNLSNCSEGLTRCADISCRYPVVGTLLVLVETSIRTWPLLPVLADNLSASTGQTCEFDFF